MTRQLSIIVPCYEEAPNIKPLCTRLDSAAKKAKIDIEIILVDDYSGKGSEDTKKEVDDLTSHGQDNINLIIRKPEEGKGLSSAVLYGLGKASNDICLVMDADLQHEPESVPDLVAPIFEGKADFVFGSRHVGGGDAKKFSAFRKLVSWGATFLAIGLTKQSDPMSGFFALNEKVLKRAKDNNLSPLGYKIGLELVVRSKIPSSRVQDVPISFQDRTAGESKLTPKQYILYVLHLSKLYWFLYPLACIGVFFMGLGLCLLLLILVVKQ